jgi:hypothetical protein
MIDPLNFKFANFLRPPCSACAKPLILTRIQPDEQPGFDQRVYYCAACALNSIVIAPAWSGSKAAVLLKTIICTLVLTAVVVAVQYCFRQLANGVDVLSFLAICAGLTALMVCAAFAWDWHEARH